MVFVNPSDDNLRVFHGLHVNLRHSKLSVTIAVNATHTEYQHIVATFGKVDHQPFRRDHLMQAVGIDHGEIIAIVTLPETTLAVFHDVVHIMKTSVTFHEKVRPIAFHHIESGISRRGSHQTTVPQLIYLDNPWLDTFKKGIVYELVCRIVVAVQTLAGSYPQLPVPVTEQAGHNITADCCGITGMMDKLRKPITVILVQAEFGCHPDKTIFILADVIDESTGETFCRNKVSCLSKCQD